MSYREITYHMFVTKKYLYVRPAPPDTARNKNTVKKAVLYFTLLGLAMFPNER